VDRIEFENGSVINTIDASENIRSKRAEEQIKDNIDRLRKEINKNPAKFYEEFLGVKLYLWQKLLINTEYKFRKLLHKD
jgi:hypothetical protein